MKYIIVRKALSWQAMIVHQNETGHDNCESVPAYRTRAGGWSKSVDKAERFPTRKAAQAVLDEHASGWAKDGHEIRKVAA